MKQKITIGLLVFFLGILITACGKKNNNGGGSNPGTEYISFGDIKIPENCNGRCEQTEQATFYIENKDEYANIFIGELGHLQTPSQYAGHNIPSITDSNGLMIYLANRFLGNALPPIVDCGAVFFAGRILNGMSKSEVNAHCEYVAGNRSTYDNLRDSYHVNVQFNFDDREDGNGIHSVSVDIDTNERRTVVEFDRRKNDRLFYDRNGNALEIDRDTIHITTSSGRRAGYIK